MAFQHTDNLFLPCHWCPTQLCCASILLKLLVPVAFCPDSYSLLYLSAAVVKHYTKGKKNKIVIEFNSCKQDLDIPLICLNSANFQTPDVTTQGCENSLGFNLHLVFRIVLFPVVLSEVVTKTGLLG